MAIVKIPQNIENVASLKKDEEKIVLEINNGDFQALSGTVKRLGFKDEESLLRFALAVLKQSATRSLSITDANGKTVSLNPGEALLNMSDSDINNDV